MTDIDTAAAAIGMSWKVKEILRDALGGDFAVTNSGIGPARVHGSSASQRRSWCSASS
jgi:hypothetical protein